MPALWAAPSHHTSTSRRMGFPCPFVLGASPVIFQLSPPKQQFHEGLIHGCFPNYCRQLLCNSPGKHQAEPCPSWGLCSHCHFRESLSCSSPQIRSLQGLCSLIYGKSTSLGKKKLVLGNVQACVIGWGWGRAGRQILLCITCSVTHLLLPVTGQMKGLCAASRIWT